MLRYCQAVGRRATLPLLRRSVSTTAPAKSWESIETKWQARWSQGLLAAHTRAEQQNRPKFYCLAMFPYPSGQLHIGHVRVYTISDCLARLKRMQGFDVLHPMGWDAFGLPAENAAIERGISPASWTKSNIANAKRQLQSLGILFDWDREVTTCDEDYYKWTQWLFLKLFEQGFAYQKEALVNWDPIDKTVLANEQVDAEGRSWRSGAIVEQRSLKQWFLRISAYGDRLLDDVEKLAKWPEAVKRMQTAWIGRSKGSFVRFGMQDPGISAKLPVFTTRVDTIFGVSFVSIAPESPIMDELLPHVPSSQRRQVEEYMTKVKRLSREARNKGDTTSGIFTGLYASHPFTKAKIPIYLAEYVLPEYGTGVVMGVPAHDTRDFAFAMAHSLGMQQVVANQHESGQKQDDKGEFEVFSSYGILMNSGEFSGLSSEEAIQRINGTLQQADQGGEFTQFRLRDWLVSRQRYWGTPVPVVHCNNCGPVGVPLDQLPVQLPEMGQSMSSDLRGGDGESVLARMHEWKHTTCPSCGSPAERDCDTLDTFVDSSWYYLRYPDARNDQEPFKKELAAKWLQGGVDLYVGGIEHAILHLLYSRFITKFLFDQQMLPCEEPFAQLLAQGMVLGRTHKSANSLRFLKPSEYYSDSEGIVREKSNDQPVVTTWEKMSKSKYNGVDPERIRSLHGADVTRLVVLFKAPPANDLEWEENDLAGQSRWLGRVWTLVDIVIDNAKAQQASAANPQEERQLRLEMHGTIKRVTEAFEQSQAFNVAIAELMKLSNVLGEKKQLAGSHAFQEAVESLVTMLAPLAPHNASEMYEKLQQASLTTSNDQQDVHEVPWPKYDESLLADAQVQFVLQVQGKVRGTIEVPSSICTDKDQVVALAMKLPNVQKFVANKTLRKSIFITPKKAGAHGLLNLVVS